MTTTTSATVNSQPEGILPLEGDFAREAANHAVVPVWIELVADSETPLSVLSKLGSEEPSFLLESAEQSDLVGRYSFVGSGARAVISSRGDQVSLTDHDGESTTWTAADPLKELETLMARYRSKVHPELPGFNYAIVLPQPAGDRTRQHVERWLSGGDPGGASAGRDHRPHREPGLCWQQ